MANSIRRSKRIGGIYIVLIEFEKVSNRVFRNIPNEISPNRWVQLCNIGLITNKIRLIHSGTLHYMDYANFDDILKLKYVATLFNSCYCENARFKFRSDPSTDQRKEIGLFIGTAVGIESLISCSDVLKPAYFRKTSHSNEHKIADYQVIGTNLNTITIEVKGRQNASLNMAQNSCTGQLATYQPPKYSFIVKTNYNHSTACKCFIDDPDIRFENTNEQSSIVNALRYYSKCMNWAGYYQFAERLIVRSNVIEEAKDFEYRAFNKQSIADELVQKLGNGYVINSKFFDDSIPENSYRGFIKTGTNYIDDNGMHIFNNMKYGFFVTQKLFDTLVEQDFEEILDFKEEEHIFENEGISFDLRQDGTVLVIKQ